MPTTRICPQIFSSAPGKQASKQATHERTKGTLRPTEPHGADEKGQRVLTADSFLPSFHTHRRLLLRGGQFLLWFGRFLSLPWGRRDAEAASHIASAQSTTLPRRLGARVGSGRASCGQERNTAQELAAGASVVSAEENLGQTFVKGDACQGTDTEGPRNRAIVMAQASKQASKQNPRQWCTWRPKPQ